MRNLYIYFITAILFYNFTIYNLWAQESNNFNNADILAPPPTTNTNKVPEEYNQEDFPDWAYYVYRFTAITVGSIPFSVLFATMGYDVYKTIDASIYTNEFQGQYLPLFFSGPEKPAYTNDEVVNILWTTLAISLTISVVDLIIVLVRQQNKRTIQNLFR